MTAQHAAPEGQTLGALVHPLSEQILELIRSEIRLAQAEATPVAPERAVQGIKDDIATLRGANRG